MCADPLNIREQNEIFLSCGTANLFDVVSVRKYIRCIKINTYTVQVNSLCAYEIFAWILYNTCLKYRKSSACILRLVRLTRGFFFGSFFLSPYCSRIDRCLLQNLARSLLHRDCSVVLFKWNIKLPTVITHHFVFALVWLHKWSLRLKSL